MDNSNSTDYGYAVSIGRRWPVRHHSQMGWEHSRRPTWWYPHHPKRQQYIWRRVNTFGHHPDCWRCRRRKAHPWWDCEERSIWYLSRGLTPHRAHQSLKATAQRKWRHLGKALLRQGDYDTLPYQSVDWYW